MVERKSQVHTITIYIIKGYKALMPLGARQVVKRELDCIRQQGPVQLQSNHLYLQPTKLRDLSKLRHH